MIVSNEKKFIFCHVPRTGGTSITKVLQNSIADTNSDGRLHHASVVDIRDFFKVEYSAFGFCRNPFSRAVSWFTFGVTKLPTAEVKEEFAAFLQQLRPKYWQNAWYYLTFSGAFINTEVGRFETFQQDFRRFWKHFIEDSEPPTLPHERNSSLPVHYSEYFNDLSRDIVLQRNHLDFEGFGYAENLK